MALVSVIIPTLNRAVSLEKTIQSILSNNNDLTTYEIIVIDNGSTDNTAAIVKETATNYANVFYFLEPINGLLSGRHRGAKEAKGDILLFADDDIRVCKNWIEKINQSFDDKDIHLVGGAYLPLYESEPPAWVNNFWHTTPYGGKVMIELSLLDLGDKKIEVEPHYVFGLCYAIRKDSFYMAGGFHPDSMAPHLQRFQGDGETGLSFKLQEKGYKALYNPDVVVYHEVPTSRMTIGYFDKRHFFQGVCDAYTQIRANKQSKKIDNFTLFKLKLASVKNNLLWMCKLLDFQSYLNKRLLHKRIEGEYFLHKQAQEIPNVLRWITKEDYWDYDYTPYN